MAAPHRIPNVGIDNSQSALSRQTPAPPPYGARPTYRSSFNGFNAVRNVPGNQPQATSSVSAYNATASSSSSGPRSALTLHGNQRQATSSTSSRRPSSSLTRSLTQPVDTTSPYLSAFDPAAHGLSNVPNPHYIGSYFQTAAHLSNTNNSPPPPKSQRKKFAKGRNKLNTRFSPYPTLDLSAGGADGRYHRAMHEMVVHRTLERKFDFLMAGATRKELLRGVWEEQREIERFEQGMMDADGRVERRAREWEAEEMKKRAEARAAQIERVAEEERIREMWDKEAAEMWERGGDVEVTEEALMEQEQEQPKKAVVRLVVSKKAAEEKVIEKPKTRIRVGSSGGGHACENEDTEMDGDEDETDESTVEVEQPKTRLRVVFSGGGHARENEDTEMDEDEDETAEPEVEDEQPRKKAKLVLRMKQ